MAFSIDTTLGFRLELGLDAVEQLVEALGWASLRASHDTGRVVVHASGWVALLREGAKMGGVMFRVVRYSVANNRAWWARMSCGCLAVARLLSRSWHELSELVHKDGAGPLVGATGIGWM